MHKNKNKSSYFLIIILAFFIGLFFLIKLIKIKNIECKSQYGPCSNEAQVFLKNLEGKKLSEVRKSIKQYLKEGLVIVDFEAHFKLPNKYEVNIIERKSKYALSFNDNQKLILVDSEGYILSFVENTSLPIVKTSIKPENAGDRVNNATLFSLELMNDLYKIYEIKEGEIKEDSFVVKLNSGERVIFPLEEDREILLSSLTLILSKLNSVKDDLTINVSTIDLRFKNPVLR